jgi:hypothetical protein
VDNLQSQVRLLRLFLFLGCAGWAISVFGVFLPWDLALAGLMNFGAERLPSQPMLDYWLRMASTAFTLIGVLFGIAGANPRKYAAMIPLLGWFSVVEGLVLAFHGIRLGLAPFPFLADTLFCLFVGLGILLAGRRLAKTRRPPRDSGQTITTDG